MFAVMILIVQFLILSIVNSTSGVNNIVASMMILIFSISFFIYIQVNEKLQNYSIPLFLGYMWRIFLLYFDVFGHNIYSLPNSGADSSMYYRTSVQYVTTGDAGRGEMFSTVMGSIFSFIGTNRLYGQFLIMLCSIVSIIMLIYTLQKFQIQYDSIYRSVGIVALLPNFAILSSIFLRESLITMLLSISLYCFSIWLNNNNWIGFISSCCFALFASLFHSGSIAVIVGYIAVLILYDAKLHRFQVNMGHLLPALLVIIVLAYLLLNYTDTLFAKMAGVNSISDIGNTYAGGGSSYAQYVGDSSSIKNMLIYTIPRMLYFLFSPFPWQWRGINDIIAFVFSSLFYFIVLGNVYRYIKKSRYNEHEYKGIVLAIVTIALCTAFVFSWGVTNTGTATRHREKMIIIYAVLFGITKHNTNIRSVMFGNIRLL